MKTSRFPEITDELLSAYIDDALSESERALVEQAAGEDRTIAWRLTTLRETVQLLHTLPVLQAPRAFALTAELLGQATSEHAVAAGAATIDRTPRPPRGQAATSPGAWTRWVAGWRQFWQAGSPIWRNAMATSMAALLVLLMLPALLGSNVRQDIAAQLPDAANLDHQESAAAGPMALSASEEQAAAAKVAPSASSVAELSVAEPSVAAPSVAASSVAASSVAEPSVADSAATASVDQFATPIALSPTALPSTVAAESRPARAGAEPLPQPADAPVGAAAANASEGNVVRTIPAESPPEDPLAIASAAAASAAAAPAYAAGVSNAPAAAAPAGEMVTDAPLAESAANLATDVLRDTAFSTDTEHGATTLALSSTEAHAAADGELSVSPVVTPTPPATEARAGQAGASPASTQVVALNAQSRQVAISPTAQVAAIASSSSRSGQLLFWLQTGAVLAAGGFGLLWWRSRRVR
ncbi:MAG: zf-HC2 domain-containing protein [Caldilineaceae bacterium]|jgi:hypothetical protein|nr:zf-HC2 domain-containing protein [Caldilineaceae bacterium]